MYQNTLEWEWHAIVSMCGCVCSCVCVWKRVRDGVVNSSLTNTAQYADTNCFSFFFGDVWKICDENNTRIRRRGCETFVLHITIKVKRWLFRLKHIKLVVNRKNRVTVNSFFGRLVHRWLLFSGEKHTYSKIVDGNL